MADLFKEKWDEFCDNLKDVGSVISKENKLSETDQAEGYIQGNFKNIHFYKEDVLRHAVTSYNPGLAK